MILRTGNRAFTLIEVMVAATVLSLGAVMVSQSFFISLNSFNYCTNYLTMVSWMDEKIWRAQDALTHLGPGAPMETAGTLINQNVNFSWTLSYGALDEISGLYKIDLILSWKEANRKIQLSRSAYALVEEKQ